MKNTFLILMTMVLSMGAIVCIFISVFRQGAKKCMSPFQNLGMGFLVLSGVVFLLDGALQHAAEAIYRKALFCQAFAISVVVLGHCFQYWNLYRKIQENESNQSLQRTSIPR